jgi:hypothetical protein
MKSYKMILLADTKEERIKLSEKVQEHAFKLGYVWFYKQQIFKHTEKPFLYFHDDGDICYGGFDDLGDFLNDESDFVLITPEEFLRLNK